MDAESFALDRAKAAGLSKSALSALKAGIAVLKRKRLGRLRSTWNRMALSRTSGSLCARETLRATASAARRGGRAVLSNETPLAFNRVGNVRRPEWDDVLGRGGLRPPPDFSNLSIL
jgi:hypothetical protein